MKLMHAGVAVPPGEGGHWAGFAQPLLVQKPSITVMVFGSENWIQRSRGEHTFTSSRLNA